MTAELLFLIIIITHWVAYFVLQGDDEAINKSSDIRCLFLHATKYTAVWAVVIIILMIIFPNLLTIINMVAIPIIFLSHALIDYYTSKANTQLFNKNNRHIFFTSIGLDQVMHYLQLFYTFKLLWNVPGL